MRPSKLLLLALVAVSSNAFALEHVMKVDEVLLDGGNGEQFIELHDINAESLPNAPYELVIYNSCGTMTETVTLTGLTAGAANYYVVGNTAAATTYSSVTFNATLTMALPNPGQACFQNGTNKIHCVAWGCGQTIGTANAQEAEAPASGMSLSRPVAGGPIQYAAPTPKAANSGGTVAPSCPFADDAGITPDANNGNNPDAGTGGGGGGDEDSGCCQTSNKTPVGGVLLAMMVLCGLLRRRRRA